MSIFLIFGDLKGLEPVWIFQHLDPNFRAEFDLTSGLKLSNFGAKSAQLQKPAIPSKQLPKKCQKIHTDSRPHTVVDKNNPNIAAKKPVTKTCFAP